MNRTTAPRPTIEMPCPACGRLLVERVNRQTGEPFLGCSQYPRCCHTEPLPEWFRKVQRGDPQLPGF